MKPVPKIHLSKKNLLMITAAIVIGIALKALITPDFYKLYFANGNTIKIEIADTSAKQMIGLMYRKQLPKDQGMLFVFQQENIYSFWMKNTLIPLDMIWIDSNWRIVDIKNAIPCTTEPCESYASTRPAKFILEINGGEAKKNNLLIGQEIFLTAPKTTY